MSDTFVYGSPLGFDLYEDIESLKDYFKGFYISTRRGRRLMINRRNNGETVYSYLRYGFTEKEGRPNAFFGFSYIFHDEEYAKDFKEVFDWFDYLFNKLVERGHIFFLNSENTFQFKVAKFKDADSEINWLKSNIPNLFKKTDSAIISRYDSTFSNVASSQIKCFNIDTPEQKIIDVFKKLGWIAVSPEFKPEEEPIEIDFAEVDKQLNEYNSQLVNIAISMSEDSLPILEKMAENCRDLIALSEKFVKTERNSDELYSCRAMVEKCQRILSNIHSIEDRISEKKEARKREEELFKERQRKEQEERKTEEKKEESHQYSRHQKQALEEETEKDKEGQAGDPYQKRCKRCGRTLPISSFESVESSECKECATGRAKKYPTRKCLKCGELKPITKFDKGSEICRDCTGRVQRFWEKWDLRLVAALGIAIVLGIIALCIIFGVKDNNPVEKTEEAQIDKEKSSTYSQEETQIMAQIAKNINEEKFQEAYNIILEQKDPRKYLPVLKDCIEDYLWNIILTRRSNCTVLLPRFFYENEKLTKTLNIDEGIWIAAPTNLNMIESISQHPSLTSTQRDLANSWISNLPEGTEKNKLKEIIASKPVKGITVNYEKTEEGTEDKDLPDIPTTETVTSIAQLTMTVDGNSEEITGEKTVTFPIGTMLEFSCNVPMTFITSDPQTLNAARDKKSCKVEVRKEGKNIEIMAQGDKVIVNGRPN